MSRRGSLIYQADSALRDKLRIGQSKHEDKQRQAEDGRRVSDQYIYSWSTYRAYMKHSAEFVEWCRTNYGAKTLQECRPLVDFFLMDCQERQLSPYTIKLKAAALAKLYGCSAREFVKTPRRTSAEVHRSRGKAARDAHFSETRNAELVEFCRSTGLRRSELESLTGNQLGQNPDGSYFLTVKGKGGRTRHAPIIGTPEAIRAVVARCEAAGAGLVWGKVHSAADIHGYRADYATAIYRAQARPIDQIPRDTITQKNRPAKDGKQRQSQVYTCRGDKAGIQYDRAALRAASEALGHNRVSVVAEHYLRG